MKIKCNKKSSCKKEHILNTWNHFNEEPSSNFLLTFTIYHKMCFVVTFICQSTSTRFCDLTCKKTSVFKM